MQTFPAYKAYSCYRKYRSIGLVSQCGICGDQEVLASQVQIPIIKVIPSLFIKMNISSQVYARGY